MVVGRIVKPHGLRGEVVVIPMTDVPGRFDAGRQLVAGSTQFTIATSRPHQSGILVRFEGIEDRTGAERLRALEVRAEAASAGADDTYLMSELVGMAVRDDGGTDLGSVRAVIELPVAAEYDLLEIERADGTTWLLPATGDYVEVDEDADGVEFLVLVDPPEGLLDQD